MRNEIADATTLMDQAAPTITTYLRVAAEAIDGEFGEGFSDKHPELVGAFIQAASLDYVGSLLSKAVTEGTEKIADHLENLWCSVGEISRAIEEKDFV